LVVIVKTVGMGIPLTGWVVHLYVEYES
jgi:hypothetical protein